MRFTDFKERLKRCEEILAIRNWDTEKNKIIDFTGIEVQREVSKRFVPIETQLRQFNHQMQDLMRQPTPDLTPKQERQDAMNKAW